MRRSSLREASCVLLGAVLIPLLSLAVQGSAGAHGDDEARWHDLPAAEAPALEVTADGDSHGVFLHLETERFAWGPSTEVVNYEEGTGIARLYVGDVKVGRLFGPDVWVNPHAIDDLDGDFYLVAVLTGRDLVAYASDGAEVEEGFEVSAAKAGPAPPSCTVSDEAGLMVSLEADPFGGWILTPEAVGVELGRESHVISWDIGGVPVLGSVGAPLHMQSELVDSLVARHGTTISATIRGPRGQACSAGGSVASAILEVDPQEPASSSGSWGSAQSADLRLAGSAAVVVVIVLLAVSAAVLVVRRRRAHG